MGLLDQARFLVMPSIWYETFGLSIVEAFSHGKPVIASNLGAMADIVQDGVTGLLFSPNDSEQLAEKARWLWNNVEEYETMGQNARKEYMAKYTPEKNYEMLMDIYEKAVEFHGGREQ
jgi:glycosyltransferase involved in cell wall biosynthesis